MVETIVPTGGHSFLAGGGELAVLIGVHDWAATSMGPIQTWPQSRKTTLSLILRSPVPIVTLWGDEGVMLYNDAYSVFAGDRHPSLLGAKVREGWPEVADFNDNIMKTVHGRGEVLAYRDQELTLNRKGRPDKAWLNLDYSALLDEHGRSAGVIAIVVETTEKVLADRWLAERRDRLAEMFEQAPGFIAILRGPDHVFDLVNPAYRQLIGGRDVLGQPVAKALPEVVEQGFVEILDRVYRSGEPFTGAAAPISLRTTPGGPVELRYLDFAYQPVRGQDGAVFGIFVQGSDATDRMRAEAALRDSEAQFRSFAEAAPNHVWTSLPDGLLDWFNPRVYDYSGARPGELDGQGWGQMVHPDDFEVAAERWAMSLARGEPYEAEFRLRRADGAYRWHIARAAPLRDETGAVTRWIGTNTDVDDLRSAQAALADLNATLELRVEERAAELERTQEQLRQSQKMEAVGQLTGGIAHDFNNLLQGITGSLDLMQKRIAQGRIGELDRFVAGAMTSAGRASALTHRLLAFSRRQPLEPRPVRANPLVASMEDLLRRTLGERIELELVLAGGLWPTLCDPNQLENALLNLAINARDAMPDGGKLTIETGNAHLDSAYVAARGDLQPGQYVCLSVTDTGTGMDAETLVKAFEPFFTTKPIGQGTGLGLSMIYGFTRQSDGHARIYSEPGAGTTVKLYLPRHRGPIEEAGPASVLAAVPPAREGETVLVVEDEPVVRGLIVEVLRDLGYQALEADDGPAGLEMLRSRRRIDLLVTDVGLPGLNGRQVADAGRSLRPGLKVLFMTGYAENAAFASGFLETGMSMITKPFAMEHLAARIRGMLEG
jgi:PAS domain S-box-containing protein